MILAVVEAGYEDHVVLSSDFAPSAGGDEKLLKKNWGSGYGSVILEFLPKLRYAGLKEATIRKFLVDNPRRFLAFVPKKSTT